MFRATPPVDLPPEKGRYPLSRRLGGLQEQAGSKEYLAFTEDRSPEHPTRSPYLFITHFQGTNKVAPVYDMKTYGGSIGITPLIVKLGAICRLEVKNQPRSLY